MSQMCEDEVAVEMDRPRRAGKGPHGGKGNKHHCKMCDCNYTVNWGTHKQSVWHRVSFCNIDYVIIHCFLVHAERTIFKIRLFLLLLDSERVFASKLPILQVSVCPQA